MIPETQQDQAALYVLGSLEAEEARAFEKALQSNEELRRFVREIREAWADVGQATPQHRPPADLKQRVLREIALEKQSPSGSERAPTARVPWLPWSIAALFMALCGMLAVDRARLQREGADVLSQVTFITLGAPSPDQPTNANVTVAWRAEQQSGVITINHLPPPGPGRDYQLWAVDASHTDPVNAGLLHVNADGTSTIRFKPDQRVTQIKAFAISLERQGGVPKREGPIVMIGTA